MGASSSVEQKREVAVAQLKKKVVEGAKEHQPNFFDRKEELQKLFEFLRREPAAVMLMIGPKDCGKTALLRKAKELWEESPDLMARSPILYIDCRLCNFGDLDDAAVAMQDASQTVLDRLAVVSQGVEASLQGGPVALSAQMGHVVAAFRREWQVNQGGDLLKLMNSLQRSMARYPAMRPIFMIDDANCLKEWPPGTLKRFLNFFLALSKQDHRAYLILSSSDDLFMSWVLRYLQDGQWIFFAVGPFNGDDARTFYDCFSAFKWRQYVDDDWEDEIVNLHLGDSKTINDEDWKKVFEVCGGSPLLLRLCATEATKSPLDQVLDGLVEDAKEAVSRGLDGMQLWDGSKYLNIMKILVHNDHIGYDDVVRVIYRNDENKAKTEVRAMLSENVIHVRYARVGVEYADLVIPQKHHRLQIMARSPAQLAAMKDYLGMRI